MLAASCAIAEEMKVIEKLQAATPLEAVIARQYYPSDSRRLVRQSDRRATHVAAMHRGFDPTANAPVDVRRIC